MALDLKSKLQLYMESKPAHVTRTKPKGPDVDQVLDGNEIVNDSGSFYMVERRYSFNCYHGGYKLGHILGLNLLPMFKACRENGREVDLRDLVFLDTETTGLGGTGTVAFLIGVGFFSENEFVLQQFFMRDYDEELAMLKALNEKLALCKGLVTFNGKAFDINLLQTRYTFNRMRLALKNPVHIDLLYPARMLWRNKLESCRLSSLESNILGLERIDDIPGSMIPSTYFKYLDTRNAIDIKKVIEHNETDILSMVSLMTKINLILTDPIAETVDWLELLGTGRLFEKTDDSSRALHCYTHCAMSGNSLVRETSLMRLANIYKQRKDYEKAVEKLEMIVASSKPPNIPIMIELAKHYEHRLKNIQKALEIVHSAMNTCISASFFRNMYLKDLQARLERLKRKALSSGITLVPINRPQLT